MPLRLPNLTERLQVDLGLQQAQTLGYRDNVVGDAIGRLLEQRGDQHRLLALWQAPSTAGPTVVDDWNSEHHGPTFERLREILDVSLRVMSRPDGLPRTFVPFGPRFVAEDKGGTAYREIGRSVVEGLWGGDPSLRSELEAKVRTWETAHPLARLLAPLTQVRSIPSGSGRYNLRELLTRDRTLLAYRDRYILSDWHTYLRASDDMSVDEQIEAMGAVIGLHLHVLALRRLAVEHNGIALPVAVFAQVPSRRGNVIIQKAANAFFGFWRDRAETALYRVATEVVEEAAKAHTELEDALSATSWHNARGWSNVELDTRAKKFGEAYRTALKASIDEQELAGSAPDRLLVRNLVAQALFQAFTPKSGVQAKVKDYLRSTGLFAGIVGPEAHRARKRYFMGDRALELLVRLHAARRPEEIESSEDEKSSIEAFLDDSFERYGIFFGLDRPKIRAKLLAGGNSARLGRLLPNEAALSENRRALERRLDALRLVRRYSDASATLYVPR